MHPVLLAQHLARAVAVRREQPLEQAHPQAPRLRLARDHRGRQLAVVSREHHPRGP
jgi:hypothetical protein